MSLSYDIIKMNMVREGYLPNHPYHMISDAEMCDAFLSKDSSTGTVTGYFVDYYPCLDASLQSAYDEIVSALLYHINKLKASNDSSYELPDWVQSYMLTTPISINSDKLDIHDMLVSLGIDNLDDEFTAQASKLCYEISANWVHKLPPSKYIRRPPTIFGEPHVLKYLRLQEVDAT